VISDYHLEVEKNDDVILVRLGKFRDLDDLTTDKISDELLGLPDRPDCNHLLLDFTGVGQLSSAMMAKLVQLHRKMESKGQKLKLCGMSAHLRTAFATTMLDRILDISDD